MITFCRSGVMAATAASLIVFIPSTAGAASAPVDAGSLSWTQYNVYDAAPARTWLGYVSRPGGFEAANGSAAAIAPASGPTVNTTSQRGADKAFTWNFSSTTGSYDPDTGVGTIEFDGGIAYRSAGHGITIDIDDPVIALSGLTGTLTASGQYTGGTQQAPTVLPYTDEPVFTLDLSRSSVLLRPDGSREICGIVPTLSVTGLPFPGNYIGGISGPDRTPNNFGSFSVRIKQNGQLTVPTPDCIPGPQGPKGDTGAAGIAGVQGAGGEAGAKGATGEKGATGATGEKGEPGLNGAGAATVRRYVAYLRKAPYTGKRSNRVSIRRNGKAVASGTIRGRVLRVTLAGDVRSLSGRYTIRLSGGSKRSTSIAIG